MNIERVLASLDLPVETMVEQRIGKKLLIENGAVTATDKRQINEGIEELTWVAALKPNTIGVPEYKDAEREILEIAVLCLSLRPEAKQSRIVELIHRAIPYPLLLLSTLEAKIGVSVATKRWAQNEGGKTVLDMEPLSVALSDDLNAQAFLKALSLRNQHSQNLRELYIGWKSLLEAYRASGLIGVFKPSLISDEVEKRRIALEKADDIRRQLIKLRTQAGREKQMNRRVDLNVEIKKLESQLAEAIREMA